MTIWIDAQLSPSLALWINQHFENVEAQSIKAVGLRDSTDKEIYKQAAKKGVIIMTKDDDFLKLLEYKSDSPQIIWITCGNTSNQKMRDILEKHLKTALRLLKQGNKFVEISDK